MSHVEYDKKACRMFLDCLCHVFLGFFVVFFNCIFYQLLRVQHSCSSTQSWGSVLPSIVETRDQNSRGCPLLFLNRNWDLCVHSG